jgi:hypothetical protein
MSWCRKGFKRTVHGLAVFAQWFCVACACVRCCWRARAASSHQGAWTWGCIFYLSTVVGCLQQQGWDGALGWHYHQVLMVLLCCCSHCSQRWLSQAWWRVLSSLYSHLPQRSLYARSTANALNY